jgi:hypothetical protein
MARVHLFEFEDQKWFPAFLRNYLTDFLQYGSNKFNLYSNVTPILKKGIDCGGSLEVIDLCSGGGGGLISLAKTLKADYPDLKIRLTDFYPNKSAFDYTQSQSDVFEFVAESVDARKVPSHLKGLRTQFLSFHHFRKDDARAILQNAVDAKSPIAIFEAQERSLQSLLFMFLSPVSVLLTTPFIRPFKAGRIFFTYIIPLVPVFVWWDGIVSSLRTYSVKEMNQLISELKNSDDFVWETGKVKSGPGKVLYLAGWPVQKSYDQKNQ